jgi:hypothetical protein
MREANYSHEDLQDPNLHKRIAADLSGDPPQSSTPTPQPSPDIAYVPHQRPDLHPYEFRPDVIPLEHNLEYYKAPTPQPVPPEPTRQQLINGDYGQPLPQLA